MSCIDVGGVTLCYERWGPGPALLCIPGAGGDAGLWARVAEALADEYTVVSYDRRGNSRSPRPRNWTSTSIDEQADDAARLLGGLALAPATVLGSGAGGAIATDLMVRHPEVVRAAVIHEPPFLAVGSDPDEVRRQLGRRFEQGMARGGPDGAMEALLRWSWGEHGLVAAGSDLLRRLLPNGQVYLDGELGALIEYLPTPADLAGVQVPRVVAAGADNRPPAAGYHHGYEASRWLAGHLHTDLVELPGGHAPYLTHPAELTRSLRPLLRTLTG